MNIQELFLNGVDRMLPALWEPPQGLQINLGPGDRKEVRHSLDSSITTTGVGGGSLSQYQSWVAPGPLPFEAESVAAIHCYQFIEHFDWPEIQVMMLDWQRVLVEGGCVYLVTPHQASSMSYQALDHKTHWNEEVWDWMIGNQYYKPEGHRIELWVNTCFIMGLVMRNLNLFTQLVKGDGY
jgi:hypothetical protein